MAQSNGADHQAELEARLARYVSGDMHALDGFDEHQDEVQAPTVMNAGERQVRGMMARQRPTLDPATQKLWNNWFDRRLAEKVRPLAEHIGKKVGWIVKENNKSIDAHDELVADVEELEKKSTEAHNLLVEDVRKIRDSVKADVSEAVRRLDRNFITEVAELRSKTLVNLSEDISVMKNDVIAVVRANVVDDLREAMVKEMNTAVADKFQKMRGVIKRYIGWLSNKDRQVLVAEIRDGLVSEMRSELAAAFVQMREDVVKEVRAEILKGIFETPQGTFEE